MGERKAMGLLTLLLLLGIILTGCLGEEKKAPPSVKLVAPDSTVLKLLNLPLYVAMEKNFFDEQGLECTLQYSKSNEESYQKLKANQADIAYLNIEKAIMEKKKQPETDVVFFFYPFRGLGAYLIAREPMPSFQWPEIKKASIIGHNIDSFSEMTLENQLRQNQLIPQEDVIIFRNIPFRLMPGAFKAGIGNYLYAFQPVARQFEDNNLGHIVASLDSQIADFPIQTYVSSKGFLDKHPLASQYFVNGLYKAQLWIERYPSNKIALLVKEHFEELEEEELIAIIDQYKQEGYWQPQPIPTTQGLDTVQDILIAGGAILAKTPSKDLLHVAYTEKAVKTVTLPVEKKKTFWDKVKDFFTIGK